MTRANKGFTLIELLTVMAIIAILAAIIFPVMARVKDSAYRGSDTANLNSLRTAMGLYNIDQGGYPPAILGYASLYLTGPNAGNIVPADQATAYMYPRRIDSIETLRPAMDRVERTDFTKAYWPNQDTRPVGSAPFLDLNGDGVISSADDTANARQALGPSDLVTHNVSWIDYSTQYALGHDLAVGGEDPPASWRPTDAAPHPADATIPSYFYNVSGYDVAKVREPDGSSKMEIHYAKFWTVYSRPCVAPGVPSPCGGDAQDDPRQLGYADPPATTVITWDSYFREYESNVPTRSKRDIVLFLGGGAKSVDSLDMSNRSWRITP